MTRILISLLFAGSLLSQLIVPTRAGLMYPIIPVGTSAVAFSLNQTSDLDKGALVFYAPVTSSGAGLTHVRFEISTTPTAQPLTIDVQTVNAATGAPTGDLAWADASGSLAVPATAIHEIELTAGGAVTAGTPLAIVIYFTGTAGNLNLNYGANNPAGATTYNISMNDGGAWTKATVARGSWAVKIDGTWYPTEAFGNAAFQTPVTAGDTYHGIRIVSSDYTARATHVCFLTTAPGAGNEIAGVIYSGNSTVASTVVYDADLLPASGVICMLLATPLILQRGVGYDVMVYRSSGSGALNIFRTATGVASDALAMWEYGNNISAVTCTGTCGTAANRTADTDRRYFVSLRLDAIYAGAGGFQVVQ